MSVVGGTKGYVSGQVIFTSEGKCCDNHPDKPATKRVVGEVDQYGYEASDFCDDCFAIYEKIKLGKDNVCDWCGCHSDHLRPMTVTDNQDNTIDKVCDRCIAKQIHEAVGQMEEEEDVTPDHGVDCHVEDKDEDNYLYNDTPPEEMRPLNFNTSRW